MTSTARRRAMEALKRQRAPAPAGPLFAVAEEGAEYAADALDKVAVLFPLPLPEPFDYRAAHSLGLKPGMHVIAPIGPRLVRGVVWAVDENHPGAANLKAIEEVLPGPPIPEISRAFLDWAAKYLVRPPGDLLRMVARSPEALFPPPTHIVLAPTGDLPPKVTEARRRVLEEAAKEQVSSAELARRADREAACARSSCERIFVRHVIAHRHRQTARKRRSAHESVQRLAFGMRASDDLDHHLAWQRAQTMPRRDLRGARAHVLLDLRRVAVVQRHARAFLLDARVQDARVDEVAHILQRRVQFRGRFVVAIELAVDAMLEPVHAGDV